MGTGTWFAVLEFWRTEDESTSRSVFLAHEKCEGKDRAIDAARKLLVLHAEKFSDEYAIEINIYTDLEWRPDEE